MQGAPADPDEPCPAVGWSSPEGAGARDAAVVTGWQFLEATNPWVLGPGFPRLAAPVERAMPVPEIAGTTPVPA